MRLQELIARASSSRGGRRRGVGGEGRPSRSAPDVAEGHQAALDAARRLVEEDQVVEAIDLLAAANRRRPGAELELSLLDLRHSAASALVSAGRTPWPPVVDDPFPDVVGRPPEVDRAGLDDALLTGSVAHHGCLLVRGLYDAAQVSRTIAAIHEAEQRRDRPPDGEGDRWYRPFPEATRTDRGLRRLVAEQGGTWLADSPASTALVLDDLDRTGAIDAVAGHLGERPVFSLQKSTLRRSPPVHGHAAWHQDGSFLGAQTRAMNVWIALSPCGGEIPTPGLEVVPRRVEELLPIDGGFGSASISNESAWRAGGETPPIRPEFAPGDAMMFDERFLHRTHLTPNMVTDRYALECWFFAPAYDAVEYLSFLA